MIQNGSDLSLKIPKKFVCKKCDYTCSNKKDYKKHLVTRKHMKNHEMIQNGSDLSQKNPQPTPSSRLFKCECGKTYKWSSGFYRHKSTCYIYEEVVSENDTVNSSCIDIDKELLIKMLLKNQDVLEKIVEVLPNIGNYSNNTNSNNQFNIQMFLNEKCKNAMNLTEFINTLPITAETYDHTIENGLTKTITHMITNGLNQLDVLERPIHCTDVSRKTLYVKDNDVWEKDTELNSILQGIKTLSIKQRTTISKWHDANEDWDKNEDLQTKLTRLIYNSMEDVENMEKETNKIVKCISKSVHLNNDIKQLYLH
jgi:hypothetical protein